MKRCILDDKKICTNCRECDMCDLDPKKVCDNCGKCLDFGEETSIGIDRIYMFEDDYKDE